MRGTVRDWLALSLGALLLASFLWLIVAVLRQPKNVASHVTIGTKDQVYYSHEATGQDATALGGVLRGLGYFRDQGANVLLSRNKGGAVVSFVVADGTWNNPASIASFEEIGRHIAPSAGGFPIEVRLVDTAWGVRKALGVGKVLFGAKDSIYYYGSATAGDAMTLGQALREAGYLEDRGVSVVLSKDPGTAIGFVVSEGVWQQPEAVAGFARLARKVSAAAGGLPLQLRLLSPEMEVKNELPVQ